MICERCHSQLVLHDNYDNIDFCVACSHVQGTPIRPRHDGERPDRVTNPLHRLPERFQLAARGRGRPRGGAW